MDVDSATDDDTGTTPGRPRRRLVARALSGVVAAATVLGVGELVAVAVAPAASPFYAVGSTTVDRSPAWAREFAIDTFGTNDKPALFIGMTLLIVVASIAAGLLERRRRPVGSLVLAGLGAVGVYAALSRPTATWTYAVPTIVGVVAGIVLLRLLIHTLDAEPTSEEHSRPAPGGKVRRLPRRQFILLLGAGATVAAAAGVAGRELGRRIASVAENRRLFLIPRVAAPAPPIPVGTDLAPVGATPFVTPNAEFYRIDTALQVPQLTTDEWQLRIHGLVDRPITLDWDDLTARTPVERIITLTCVSNEIGGPLAGNARWIGYPIQDLLDEVGVHADADMLLSKSVDGFTIGTPVAALRDGRDAILAVAMNGEPLPLEHGYPVRQVVPGLYGYVSATKWVVDWELTRFDRAEAYWTKRGWGVRAPIKTASRIDVPAAFAPVTAGPVTVAGTAWAQQRGVEAVEVRVDGGPWQQATLAPEYSIDTWRQWTWEWDATPGLHRLEVRATDGTGDTQPEDRVPPIPDGATGWHSSSVTVR